MKNAKTKIVKNFLLKKNLKDHYTLCNQNDN